MRTHAALILLGVVAILAAVPSSKSDAQAGSSDALCADSATASYRDCALRYHRGRLHRGASGAIIGRQGIVNPPPLARFVSGDSACHYAIRFERHTKRATTLSWVAVGFIAASYVTAWNTGCRGAFFTCESGEREYDSLSLAFLLSGLGFTLASAPYSIGAQTAASKAVWWNNARFAR